MLLARKRLSTAALAVAGLLATVCVNHGSLEEAYRRLYLSTFALEFPSSKEAFDICTRNQVQSCLELVARAREGKEMLRAVEPQTALEHTLEVIGSACPREGPDQQEVCLGAIVALYFFREREQDALILRAVLNADRATQRKLLGPVPFAWHGNRPEPERWIDALSKLPDDAFPRTGKDAVLKGFLSPPDSNDDGGVRLL